MNDEKPMGQVIQIDEARIRDHLGEMVRGTVTSEDWEEVLPPQMAPGDRYTIKCTETLIPEAENYVCYGTIVYTTVFGDEFTTSWKHRVVREGKVLHSYALPGGYSSEWEDQP